MPKKVTPAVLARWRSLIAEGMSIPVIAKETGWQARTVRKHIQADIRSGEAQRIRQELFKERLGEHWDLLVNHVSRRLLECWPPETNEVAELVSARDTVAFAKRGCRVDWDEETGFSVRVAARDSTEWELLAQHIPRDSLWGAVRGYEDALRVELQALRDLYLTLEGALGDRLHLEVVNAVIDGPAIGRSLVRWMFAETLRAASGIPVDSLRRQEVHESTIGQMRVRDLPRAAVAPGRANELTDAINEVKREQSSSDKARKAEMSGQVKAEALKELHRLAERWTLLRYLPGVCELCSRIEV